MILPGLVSITFRQLSVTEIITRCNAAKLTGIEWGGDIHVPHGDLPTATAVAQQTRDAGLHVSAYGSYYRAGHDADLPAESVVATAQKLGAPIIRIWAGHQHSVDADADYWHHVAQDCRKIAILAADVGIKIALEWHQKTLTDTAAAATRLIAAVNHPNLSTFWQPRVKTNVDDNLEDMAAALPHLIGLHVFNWGIHTAARLPLADAASAWNRYLDEVPATTTCYASLEFVPHDDPELLNQEAAALHLCLNRAPFALPPNPLPST